MRMATEGNGGSGSSEEVPEGLQIGSPDVSFGALLADFIRQDPLPCLDSNSPRLVCGAFELFVNSGPARVAAFLMEDSTQNTSSLMELVKSDIHVLVRGAFELFVNSGLRGKIAVAFLMEDSTKKTTTWLESYSLKLVREAFGHFMNSSSAREQIQEPDRIILHLRFETSMPDHVFVGKQVKGQDGAICVKLIDPTTSHVVESGPLSSLTLDVVVLAGDFENNDDDGWTWEYFISNVEMGREGKGPLLEGDLQVPLKAGVGSLAEFKFTDISTCRRSGKYRLGVKVELGFFMGIRVREAITAAFKVKHYKKKSEEKHVPRVLGDEVCTLNGIRKKGPFHKNLNAVGIFTVEDFLWKLCLDPEGLRKILGKTMSDKNWKTLGDHAKESVPSGKYHVYFADNMKNSGIVFKNMSELCDLIEDGKYYLAETLSDSHKVFASLKKKACANWKDIGEYESLQLLPMNPSKRARSSQTDEVELSVGTHGGSFELRKRLGGGGSYNPQSSIGGGSNPMIQGNVIREIRYTNSLGGNVNNLGGGGGSALNFALCSKFGNLSVK